MSAARTLVPAVGGERQVPAPDPIARDYLLLALRLDQHRPGFVDGFYGPADLKAQVDLEPLRPPTRLREDAADLRGRADREIEDLPRRGWLTAQLTALEAQAELLAGDPLPYEEHVRRSFGVRPARRPEREFELAAATIDGLLPGPGSVADRLAAWDAASGVPTERLRPVAEALVTRFRGRARALFGLPDGESVRLELVRRQPSAGYAWYDGGYRSRIDLDRDNPIALDALIRTIAHRTYPGHHLERAWREADLVVGSGRLEASVLLLDTPEWLVGEGLAELGVTLGFPPLEAADLLVELYGLAGLPFADDTTAARERAARTVAMAPARAVLRTAAVNAALMRRVDGDEPGTVMAYLREVGRVTPDAAARRLALIEHPLRSASASVSTAGEDLLRRWLEMVPEDDRVARFARSLHETLTPATIETGIKAELSAATAGDQPAAHAASAAAIG